MSVRSETLNLPGEQHQHVGWIPGWRDKHLEASAMHSRINIRHQSKAGTERIWGWEVLVAVSGVEWSIGNIRPHVDTPVNQQLVTTRKVHLS